MQRFIKELDDVSAKNGTRNDEKSVIRELVVMPVIKKESEHTPQQFVEIKKEMDDSEGVMEELVSMNQDVVVKKECVQMNLLKMESVKEEQNVINELVRPCKSEDVVNSERVITDSTVMKNEIMGPIRINKEENGNLVEELFSDCWNNTLSTKEEGMDTIYGGNKSEIVRVINVKKEEKNLVKELVSEYHENKVVVSKKNRQIDIRKFIVVNPRTELLRHSSDGKQCMQNIDVTVNRSILKPNEYSQVHPDHTKKRIMEDTQTVMDNNVHGEGNSGLKDVIKINLNTIISKEIEKQLQKEDVQRDEIVAVEHGLIKTININSILRKSVLACGNLETQAAAAEMVMDRDQKKSVVSSDQTNKITEPVQRINLVDSDDDDSVNYEMDEPSANQNITPNAMDIEFVDCDKEENNEDVPCATLLPTTGTSSEVNQMTYGHTQYDSDFIRCPPQLYATKSVLNVQNSDKRSFMWSVLAALYRTRNGYRTSTLKGYIHKINMCGIDYPVSVKSVDLFEKLNPDISVNVFGYNKEVYPVRMSTFKGRKKHIYLLMLVGKICNHYCVVTKISKLLHHLNPRQHRHYYCKYCFLTFVSKPKYEKHESTCETAPMDIKEIMKNLKCQKHSPESYYKGCAAIFLETYNIKSFLECVETLYLAHNLACREQVMIGMTEGLTTVDQLPLHSAPPVLFPQHTDDAKPPVSFPNLIRLAITSSPNNKMKLCEIFHFIIQKYPYYRNANNGWKNSIRHTLTLSKWFMKEPRPSRCFGKGGYWAMDYTNYKGLSSRR